MHTQHIKLNSNSTQKHVEISQPNEVFQKLVGDTELNGKLFD